MRGGGSPLPAARSAARDGKRDPWDHLPVPRYRARAEFRRKDLGSPWVLAGVVIDHEFWPAADGVERIRRRLREPGLQGWSDLPSEVLAPDVQTAADVALEVARANWPERVRVDIPWRDSGPGRISRG